MAGMREGGTYTITYADGSTERRRGYDNAGMLKFARENGAVKMTAPGRSWNDGDIAASALGEATPPADYDSSYDF